MRNLGSSPDPAGEDGVISGGRSVIVACPACRTRFRHAGVPESKTVKARCSRCNEVFPLEPAVAAYRVMATAEAAASSPVAGAPSPAAIAAPTAEPAPASGPEPLQPVPGPESAGLDVDLPAHGGEVGESFEAADAPPPSVSQSPESVASRPPREPKEARALPRLAEPAARLEVRRSRGRSFLRSAFNVVFALVWVGLGAAAGYFSYPGETWEPLIGSSAGAVVGLLASALMLRWISGRP